MLPVGLRSCLGILAAFGLLTGCDEDSGSPSNGVSATPTPTATATPSPTPTPTPTSSPGGASLADLRVDQTFATISTGLSLFRRTARLQVGPATTSAPTAGALLSYAVSGQAFTFLVRNPTYPAGGGRPDYGVSFDPAQRITGNSALTNARITTYGVSGSPSDEFLIRQFNPGPGNDLLALYYASMGVFRISHFIDPIFQQDVRPYAFFSQVTPAGSLPQGSVTYEGVIDGLATPKDGVIAPNIGYAYNISGKIRITVNFAARTYSGTLTADAVEDTSLVTSFSFGDVSLGQGTVSAASFAGALNEGSLLGSFAGPNGEEMGGTLLVTIPDPKQNNLPLALVSAFVAKR